jgi:hypothetical protein
MCIRGTLTCIHVTPISSPKDSLYPPPLLPPPPPPPSLPPLLSSCLAPLFHRYCRHRRFRCSLLIVAAAATRYLHRRRFRCSLLIVVCPRRCPTATATYNCYRLRRCRFLCSLLIVCYSRRCHCHHRRRYLLLPPPPFPLLFVDC